MKISVIIPVYKSEPYLARCLDSVINQTYKNLEIICIDDASPDNCIDILNEYAANDKRIKIIRHKKNMGLSDSRNDGFYASTGDWVHYFDSDDYIDLDYYEKMLSSALAAGADVSVSGFLNENKYNSEIRYFERMDLKTIKDRVYGTHVIDVNYVWRYLSRREFLRENNLVFPKGLMAMEDAFFSLELVRLADIITAVPDVLYYYCKNENSIMHERGKRRKIRNKNMRKTRKYRMRWAVKHGFWFDWFILRLLRKL